MVGPVYLLYDQNGVPLTHASPRPILAVSAPPMDLATADSPDRMRFTADGSIVPTHIHAVLHHLCTLWHHVLMVMEENGVTVPVVPGMGRAMYAPDVARDAPVFCARALRLLLRTRPGRRAGLARFRLWSYGFHTVLVTLPDDDVVRTAFVTEFRTGDVGDWMCPVVLVRDRVGGTLADHLARQVPGPLPGLFTPCNELAVRSGYVGMMWDGGATMDHEEVGQAPSANQRSLPAWPSSPPSSCSTRGRTLTSGQSRRSAIALAGGWLRVVSRSPAPNDVHLPLVSRRRRV